MARKLTMWVERQTIVNWLTHSVEDYNFSSFFWDNLLTTVMVICHWVIPPPACWHCCPLLFQVTPSPTEVGYLGRALLPHSDTSAATSATHQCVINPERDSFALSTLIAKMAWLSSYSGHLTTSAISVPWRSLWQWLAVTLVTVVWETGNGKWQETYRPDTYTPTGRWRGKLGVIDAAQNQNFPN